MHYGRHEESPGQEVSEWLKLIVCLMSAGRGGPDRHLSGGSHALWLADRAKGDLPSL